MSKPDGWFLLDQAVAFARFRFMRNGQATVRPQEAEGSPISLLVELLHKRKPTLRFFGVQLVGTLDMPTPEEAESLRAAKFGNSSDAPFPVCAFALSARELEAMWRWVAVPTIREGTAILEPGSESAWSKLEKEGADRILDEVRAWYDARNGESPKPRRKSRVASRP